jgi:hypothetical protein
MSISGVLDLCCCLSRIITSFCVLALNPLKTSVTRISVPTFMITKRTALDPPTGVTDSNTSATTAYIQLNPYYLQLVQLVQVSLGTRKPFF